MVARPGGEPHIAQLLELAADGGLVERHRELFVQPLHQVDQAPSHDTMDRRDRPALHRLDQRTPLRVIEDRPLARRLAIEQPIGTTGVEPQYPVSHDLQRHSADPGRLAPAAAIVDLRQRQQPPGLRRALRHPCQAPQRRPVEVLS